MKFEIIKVTSDTQIFEIRKDGFPIGLSTDENEAREFLAKRIVAESEKTKREVIYSIEL